MIIALLPLQTSAAGEYQCIADYGGLGEHTSQTATLTVYGKITRCLEICILQVHVAWF